MVRWFHGTMAPWRHGPMVPWPHGSMVINKPSSITDYGIILVSIWGLAGIMLGSCSGQFGVMLGSVWGQFGAGTKDQGPRTGTWDQDQGPGPGTRTRDLNLQRTERTELAFESNDLQWPVLLNNLAFSDTPLAGGLANLVAPPRLAPRAV